MPTIPFTFYDDTHTASSGTTEFSFGAIDTTNTSNFVDELYVYHTRKSLLDIYSAETGDGIVSSVYDLYLTSVWADENNVFLGTAGSGVLYFDKSYLSNYPTNSGLYNELEVYKQYPEITSNSIRCIHGNGDKIAFVTSSGVDYFKREPNGYRSYTTTTEAEKCFVCAGRNFYYTTISGNQSYLNKLRHCLTDWYEPDVVYDFFVPNVYVNDFYVSEAPVSNGYNAIFLATTSGVYVIDEYYKTMNIYKRV
jgi:hypothetical protein